ncbi:MAG: ThuA domain-containing protein [Lachnospirales bacterium]
MKKALILQGGWDGHEPKLTSKRFGNMLECSNYEVKISDTLEVLDDLDYLLTLDLVVACWTMGEIEENYVEKLSKAVASGVGLAGCHGGMCDSFRQNVQWQFMTGGQWVSHPGGDGVEYTVNINHGSSPITQGLEDFSVCSEHYYLHIDPAIEILATTKFPVVSYYHISNKPVNMPIAWTKFWGNGRVFYTSLGHHDDVFDKSPSANELMRRGLVWAGEGKSYAVENKLRTDKFENNAKMY